MFKKYFWGNKIVKSPVKIFHKRTEQRGFGVLPKIKISKIKQRYPTNNSANLNYVEK